MSDPLTIVLDPPIAHGAGAVERLVLREPRAGEVKASESALRAGQNPDSIRGQQVRLLAAVAGVPLDMLGLVPIGKIREATAYLDSFIEAGLDEEQVASETWDLDVPVALSINGTTYSVLSLREPTLADVRAAESNLRNVRTGVAPEDSRQYQITLVKMVSGWPIPAVEQLPISILNRAAVYLQGFIVGGRKTGPT